MHDDAFDALPLTSFGILDRRALPRRRAQTLLRAGSLRACGPGLLAEPRSDPLAAWWQELAIALARSWPDAAVSGAAAAALLGLDSFDVGKVPITVASSRNRHWQGPATGRSRRGLDRRIVEDVALPVTAPADALLAIAGQSGLGMPWLSRLERLELAFESALRHGLMTHADLLAIVGQGNRGVRGAALLRLLAELRPAGLVPTESFLETRFVQVARRFGLTDLERQVELYDHRGRIGRVDFFHPPVVIECDSVEHHLDVAAFHADRERRARLLAIGHPVIEATEQRIETDGAELVREIRSVAQRLRLAS